MFRITPQTKRKETKRNENYTKTQPNHQSINKKQFDIMSLHVNIYSHHTTYLNSQVDFRPIAFTSIRGGKQTYNQII